MNVLKDMIALIKEFFNSMYAKRRPIPVKRGSAEGGVKKKSAPLQARVKNRTRVVSGAQEFGWVVLMLRALGVSQGGKPSLPQVSALIKLEQNGGQPPQMYSLLSEWEHKIKFIGVQKMITV